MSDPSEKKFRTAGNNGIYSEPRNYVEASKWIPLLEVISVGVNFDLGFSFCFVADVAGEGYSLIFTICIQH